MLRAAVEGGWRKGGWAGPGPPAGEVDHHTAAARRTGASSARRHTPPQHLRSSCVVHHSVMVLLSTHQFSTTVSPALQLSGGAGGGWENYT